MITPTLFQSSLKSLPLITRGKVRDIYSVDNEHLLIITTDRLSAFDVILPDPIPKKGQVLTEITDFWLKRLSHILPNQSTNIAPEDVVAPKEYWQVKGRASVVKRLLPLPMEAVVRGYLIGSGWKDYQSDGHVCGIKLPADLKIASKLPTPVFTPATKAAVGEHDENISFAKAQAICAAVLSTALTGTGINGAQLAAQAHAAALAIYEEASVYARNKGIIIADTKFEFGIDKNGTLHLIDEVLTPDSSRFWPLSHWCAGKNPPSYDKQFIRDYLENVAWNKKAPAPKIPPDIIQRTTQKYIEVYKQLGANST